MPPARVIHLFGQPSVLGRAEKITGGLGTGKPFALLAYLLAEGGAPREKLIELLWGGMPETQARNAFRQALHRLRSALGEDAIPHDPDFLSVSPTAGIVSDIAEFERCILANDPEGALEHYHGDFLAGLDFEESAFDSWQQSKRERYKARFRDALRSCVRHDLENGQLLRAVERAAQLSLAAPHDADAALIYATALLSAGRREEALQLLEHFGERYQEDMGSPAPSAVRDMAKRLRVPMGAQEEPIVGRSPSPFLGRDSELAALLSRMASLETHRSSLALLEGDAGIGKTRLLTEFFGRAKDLGTSILLSGRERGEVGSVPFASVAEALRGALDSPGISGTGPHLLAEAARVLPELRDRFNLPPISNVTDEASRLRFFEGIAALLESVAYEQPVCVALDDFHNCSRATFDLVCYLINRLRSSPILFILSIRPSADFARRRRLLLELARHGGLSEAGDQSDQCVITVGPLNISASRKLAEESAGCALSDEILNQVLAVADGVPYRIAEISRRAGEGAAIGNAPVALREILWGRLQRCNQAEQRMFVASALIGRPASIRLLASASHISEQNALDAAFVLEREGLLIQRANGLAPAHDFSGKIALEGTGPAGHALFAAWAADALEDDATGAAAELARLFAIAGRRRKTFEYARLAGHEAIAAGELEIGLQHFRIALANISSAQERSEISQILRSLEVGMPLLSAPPRDGVESSEVAWLQDSPAQPPVVPSSAGAPGEETAGEQAQKRSGSEKRFRRWRADAWKLTVGGMVVAAGFLALRDLAGSRSAVPGTSLSDTLLVAEERDGRASAVAFTTGVIGSPITEMPNASIHGRVRSWIDSLRVPWINPLPSPDGRFVAVERVTKEGSNLFVISTDRRDTLLLAKGNGDDIASDWSPDSRYLLATHGAMRPGSGYDTDLYAYSVVERGKGIPLDTSADRAVVSALWSPDGTRIAWTARVGPQHQQDVFVSDADGSDVTNVSDNPGEDYSIGWSPDGRTLVFTSDRTGRAELYALDLGTRQLRRLTWDNAHADHAVFSPDGRWLAYESSKSGNPAVYVMPAGGGNGRSIAPPQLRVSLLGWRGRRIAFVDKIRIDVTHLNSVGDNGQIVVHTYDRNGDSLPAAHVAIRSLDTTIVRPIGDVRVDYSSPRSASIGALALSNGLAGVEASAGGWRADTAFISIGNGPITVLQDDFETGIAQELWRSLGDPLPVTAGSVGSDNSSGVSTRSDQEWESGILSRKIFPVRAGLAAEAWVKGPFRELPAPGRSLVIALVAADPFEAPDVRAPQFLRLAAFSWSSVAERFSYSVGREIFTESVRRVPGADHHVVKIRVGIDDRVSFLVDGVERWRSTLRIGTSGENSRAQLWLASQSAGSSVIFDDVTITLDPALRH